VQLMLVRIDPVQEIAADASTLDALKTALNAATKPPQAAPELLGSLTGWPLVVDPTVPAGYVHCRPTKRPE
jgi:hypothetical protein